MQNMLEARVINMSLLKIILRTALASRHHEGN